MQEEGYIARILYPDGAKDIPLGQPLALLVDDKADIPAFADWVAGGAPEPQAVASSPEPTASASVPSGSMQKSASGERQFVSPLAKRTAQEKGVDVSSIQGTGPNGRVIMADIEDALKAGPVKVAQDVSVKKTTAAKPQKVEMPNAMFKDIEVTQIRKIIAERLTHSKQNIPHYYVTVSVNVDKLLALRARLNANSSSKISVNDIVMKAASMAALKVPETNSSW